MSLSEFYLDNGLDMADLEHMDERFASLVKEDDEFFTSDHDDGSVASSYHRRASSIPRIVELTIDDSSDKEKDSAGSFLNDPFAAKMQLKKTPVLLETELDFTAQLAGWTKLDTSKGSRPTAAYKQGDIFLSFDLMDCVVRGYDDFGGARQERTQRFRKTVDMTDAPDIFFRPQFQTSNVQFLPNKSFKTAPGMIMQAASEYPKTAYPKGRCKYGRKCRNPKCGFQHSTLKCRYGIYCLKAGCPFEHY